MSREDVGGIVFCLGMLGFLIIAAAMLDRADAHNWPPSVRAIFGW